MDEPRTAAGRALLAWADELRPFGSDEHVLSPASVARIEDGIAAIEREAAAAARAEVAEPGDGLDVDALTACLVSSYVKEPDGGWPSIRAQAEHVAAEYGNPASITRQLLAGRKPDRPEVEAFVREAIASHGAATAGREPQ